MINFLNVTWRLLRYESLMAQISRESRQSHMQASTKDGSETNIDILFGKRNKGDKLNLRASARIVAHDTLPTVIRKMLGFD